MAELQAIMKAISRAGWVFLYYLSWAVFFSVGLLLNVGCAALLILPGRARYEARVRRSIRSLFGMWLSWLHASRIVDIEWSGFEEQPAAGTVYIANHPSLIDATVILARLPDAICIFKPALMRNPAIGPAAIMAGYVRGDTGVDLIKAAAEKVESGQSLLIFPEGTRTDENKIVGKMKPGFALIADRARAPVRLIIVKARAGFCRKGQAFWPAPTILPGKYRFTLDQVWPYEPGRSATELTKAVEARICEVLGGIDAE